MGKYSTSMKEVAEYIGNKFSYQADIHWYLKNNMNTGFLYTLSLNRTGDNGEPYSNQKFVWEKRMVEYVKKDTNINENCQKSYALIFR